MFHPLTQPLKHILSHLRLLALFCVLVLTLALAQPAPVDACGPNGQFIYIVFDSAKPGLSYDVYVNGQKAGTFTTQQVEGITYIYGGSAVEIKPGTDQVIEVRSGNRVIWGGTEKCLAPTGVRASIGNTPNAGVAGDPVSASLGEYFFTKPLLDLGGTLPLEFSLNYAANVNKSLVAEIDPFPGTGFTHNDLILIKSFDTYNAVFLGDGRQVRMAKDARHTEWYPVDGDTRYQLLGYENKNTGGQVLLDRQTELVYTFQPVPPKSAFGVMISPVTRIEDRHGNALVFTNDPSGQVTRIEDGLGRVLNFTYAEGRLVQVTDQAGRAIRFAYTDNRLTGLSDALGGTTAFAYAPNGFVITSQTLPRGITPYRQTYTRATVTETEPEVPHPAIVLAANVDTATIPIWRVDTQTDAFGNVTQLKFDDKGATTITDASGNVSIDTHKDNGLLTQWQDAAGKTATFGYDAQGRRTTITDRMGDALKLTYHSPSGKIASITNARGETIAYTYAPSQPHGATLPNGDLISFVFYDLVKVDYPDKSSEQFTYDPKGNVVAHVDRAGQTWKFTYNPRGQVLTVTNPTDGILTYTYNADGTLASSKDSETGETKYGYDALKRLNKITYADNAVEQIAYDANDRIIALTDAANYTTQFEYDANGNLVKTTDALSQVSSQTYDEMDRITKMTNRAGQISNFAYDKLGNVSMVTDATGVATQFTYDPRGWLNAITRGDATWKTSYDDEGVPTAITSPLGNTTRFENDKLGMVAGTTNALGHTGIVTRDSLSRVTSATDALQRTANYTYDTHSSLTSVTLPVVGTAKYEYDALGNPTKITDVNGSEWKLAYTPMGRLQMLTDPLHRATQYKHDSLGRLVEIALADGVKQTLTYDAAGNVTRLQSSDGFGQTFAYDGLNRLTDASGVKLAYDAEGRIVGTEGNAATYDAAGRLKTVIYGAVTVTYDYDAKTGLLTSVSDSVTKARVDFTYDKDRRLIGVARSNKVNTTLTWDNASRLTGIQDGDISNLQYTLDAAGQVTNANLQMPLTPNPNTPTQDPGLSYDAALQINSPGYEYDARGRLTQSPDGTFKWNSASQLVGIGQTTLTYNGLGDLAARKEGDQTTQFGYNLALNLAPIVSEASDAKPSRYYVWTPSGELLYAIEDGKPWFYHFDRTGSTLALTDASGSVTDAYAYDPYGKMLGHTGKSTQLFTFVGKWGVRQEGASGALYQMRARYYDATTQRFISPEPLWPQIDDPQLLNPYAYAYNSPLHYVDVDGLVPLDLTAPAAIAAERAAGAEAQIAVEAAKAVRLPGPPAGPSGFAIGPWLSSLWLNYVFWDWVGEMLRPDAQGHIRADWSGIGERVRRSMEESAKLDKAKRLKEEAEEKAQQLADLEKSLANPPDIVKREAAQEYAFQQVQKGFRTALAQNLFNAMQHIGARQTPQKQVPLDSLPNLRGNPIGALMRAFDQAAFLSTLQPIWTR